MAPDLFAGIAALLYLLYLWLQLRSRAIESFPNRRTAALVLPAMATHLIYAVLIVTTGSGLYLSIWSSAIIMTFIAMVCTFYLYLVQGYRVLALVTVPLAIVSLFFGLLLSPIEGTLINQPTVIVHVLISMLTYATLGLAAVQAGSIIILHQRLKKNDSTAFVKLMPPLQTVEATAMHLLWLGVSMLTLTLVTGLIFRWDFVQQGNYVMHMGIALTCWVLYLALICGQLWFGWRGQISSRLSLLAFAVLLIGFFGLKFAFGYGT
ncbi:MAG: cytochrome c biogenesis protein CcsA [Gammaproteobacteria bacterium]|nr:cytochrome c biogenesis protein CcsA [Gammaproteobacteria bacterium]